MYAIIRTGGKQYRVQEGDSLDVALIDAEAGAELTIDDVLMIEDGDDVSIGTPTVDGATVTAVIEAHTRAKKVTSLKYKNKTRQRTLHGHRQHQTRIQITGIKTGGRRRARSRS
ncbi:MAG: 50S ribosomal protein L21 [Dehalococcoidia bacterium]